MGHILNGSPDNRTPEERMDDARKEFKEALDSMDEKKDVVMNYFSTVDWNDENTGKKYLVRSYWQEIN